MKNEQFSRERLCDVLRYCPETGVFTWQKTMNGRALAGSPAGSIENNGYVRISVDGCRYQAHQLAWLYMTGEWLPQVDHENLDRADNKWRNLRPASGSQNVHNRHVLSTNTSGRKGVCWHKRLRKWQASITKDYRQQSLGYFDCPDAAHAAYAAAAAAMFGEFARSV